jgi:farnesyl diphosphate synthase
MSEPAVLADARLRVESALERWLPGAGIEPERLHAAMRYVALGPGKRVRPALVYATGAALGVAPETLDGPACALELVHAYSLVHDDLPVMDNDDLRRGRPTCHRAFDEAIAILAGDALQSLAFHVLAHDRTMRLSAERRLDMIETLAQAIGSRGMAGGQALDIAAGSRELGAAELESLHIHKTGALIRASVRLGALSQPDASAQTIARFDHYAKCIGMAFQIHDDILDLVADPAASRASYAAQLGLGQARAREHELCAEALRVLVALDSRADGLRALCHHIVERDH